MFKKYLNILLINYAHTLQNCFGIPIKLKKQGVKHNNNAIERYNSNIDNRTKTMRHLAALKGQK